MASHRLIYWLSWIAATVVGVAACELVRMALWLPLNALADPLRWPLEFALCAVVVGALQLWVARTYAFRLESWVLASACGGLMAGLGYLWIQPQLASWTPMAPTLWLVASKAWYGLALGVWQWLALRHTGRQSLAWPMVSCAGWALGYWSYFAQDCPMYEDAQCTWLYLAAPAVIGGATGAVILWLGRGAPGAAEPAVDAEIADEEARVEAVAGLDRLALRRQQAILAAALAGVIALAFRDALASRVVPVPEPEVEGWVTFEVREPYNLDTIAVDLVYPSNWFETGGEHGGWLAVGTSPVPFWQHGEVAAKLEVAIEPTEYGAGERSITEPPEEIVVDGRIGRVYDLNPERRSWFDDSWDRSVVVDDGSFTYSFYLTVCCTMNEAQVRPYMDLMTEIVRRFRIHTPALSEAEWIDSLVETSLQPIEPDASMSPPHDLWHLSWFLRHPAGWELELIPESPGGWVLYGPSDRHLPEGPVIILAVPGSNADRALWDGAKDHGEIVFGSAGLRLQDETTVGGALSLHYLASPTAAGIWQVTAEMPALEPGSEPYERYVGVVERVLMHSGVSWEKDLAEGYPGPGG